jgi:uncharacterized phage protein (TIGR02220 family)
VFFAYAPPMSPKIHQSFWSDEEIETQDSNTKLCMLWLITNQQTNLLGICSASKKRFEFETGMRYEALQRAIQALPRSLLAVGGIILIKNFIRHQFGSGEQLNSNNIYKSIHANFTSLKSDEIRDALLIEYPELAYPPKGLPKGFKAQREGTGTGAGEGTRTRKGKGSGENLFADVTVEPPKDPSDELSAHAVLILTYLNEKAGRHFDTSKDVNQAPVMQRLCEGNPVEEIKKMIDRQVAKWRGTHMEEYLQPATLFAKSNFQKYYDDRNQPIFRDTTKPTDHRAEKAAREFPEPKLKAKFL